MPLPFSIVVIIAGYIIRRNLDQTPAITAIATYSARETYRIPLNDLGHRQATPMPKNEYDRLRTAARATVN